jgi:predicted  nucleic acid-binding Zn-ribbon protein
MDQVEALQAEHKRLRVALADAENAWRQEQQDLQAQRQSLQSEQVRLDASRAELVRAADPTHLNVYEGLRRQKGGRAVARVEQSVCTGCRIAMALQVVQRARTNPGLTFCSTCGRILHVPH